VTIVFLGDSLTAGYGLAEEQAFPALLGDRLEERGIEARIVNAGVSGDTTAGGLARLDWLLSQSPDVLVVGLGGNDGLRGLEIDEMRNNLRAIVKRARERGASVLLLGMKIPPNYGQEYTTRFERVYREVATELDVPLVPFLLEGVGGVPELNLPDGIHPNAEGQRRLADNVEPHLLPLAREAASSRSSSTRVVRPGSTSSQSGAARSSHDTSAHADTA
jgi:acyl-CoA thioesterase-1